MRTIGRRTAENALAFVKRCAIPLDVFILFLFAAVVQTWPLARHLSDSVVNWHVQAWDSWVHLWNLWWVKRSLLNLENPFHTDHLFHPQGADLHLHTLDTVNGVMSIPLQLVTGNVILSWNILALILFALSGLTAYLLSYRLTHNHLAALISGYIFAFSPFFMMRFHGHWNISTSWPIPLFALFLLRLRDRGRLWDAAGAGIVWAILAYNNLEYAIDASLFFAIFVVFWCAVYLLRKERPQVVTLCRGAALTAFVAFIAAAPLLIPALQQVRDPDNPQPGANEIFSSDLEALITPSPLWGSGLLPVWPLPAGSLHFPAGDIENTVYLGITPLVLGAIAVATLRWRPRRRETIFWTIIFVLFVALAMGPYLYVGNTKEFSLGGISFSIPMPYQIYDELPVISGRRGISRLIVFGILALSALAGIGADAVLGWVRKRGAAIVVAAGMIVLALVVFEYWTPPSYVARLQSPAIFEQIGDEPGDFAVLDVPLGRLTSVQAGNQGGGVTADYYARIHGKRSVGGYLSRGPNSTVNWILQQPGLKFLACPNCGGPSPDDLDVNTVKALLDGLNVRYVVVHRLTPNGWQIGGGEDKAEAYLRDVLGLTLVYQEPAFSVYRFE